jgi:hypothetical protein
MRRADPAAAVGRTTDNKETFMTLSMYEASVPPLLQTLEALSAILDKAAAHAEVRKIDPAALLTARLYPDMFPFTRQVQLTCDFAKGAAARLAGTEPPSWPDTETSFSELKARIAKTSDFVRGFTSAQIDGSEQRPISIKAGPRELNFTGQSYLFGFVFPNFYFHTATAYGLLRHNGVELGKRDFVGLR